MFVVNEQISVSIEETPNILRAALKDAEFYVKSSNHNFQTRTFEQFDKARDNIKIELEGKICNNLIMNFLLKMIYLDIDKLLGERITREISLITRLDMTLELTAEILESN